MKFGAILFGFNYANFLATAADVAAKGEPKAAFPKFPRFFRV